jgi:hypothetical protein
MDMQVTRNLYTQKAEILRYLRDSDVVKYFQTPRSVFLLPFLVHK